MRGRRDPEETGDTPADSSGLTRKGLLKVALAAVPLSTALGGAALAHGAFSTPDGGPLTPTPMCDDGDDPTPPQTEGPYFRPNSPRRTSLVEPGTRGVRLTVSGFVFGLTCRPAPDVLLDFWQADTDGAYDNRGYRFRGHQFTDARGAFVLETVVPGLYPGRTRHLHVKAQAPGRPVLTTQLYFPDEPRNATDTLYDPALLMTVRQAGSARQGTFDFVLDLGRPGPGDPSPTPPGGSWTVGATYRAGDRVTYAGTAYECLQAHTAQPGWEPPGTPALWRRR